MNHVPSLFKQTNDLHYTLSQIAENEGEVTPELNEQLTLSHQNLAHRATWLLDLKAQAEANIQLAKDKQKQLADFAKQNQRIVDLLEGRLLAAVELFGPIDAGTHRITTRKSEQVVITDENLIGHELRGPIALEGAIDKALVKQRLKAGHAVPGAHIQTNSNLSIR